MVSQRIQLLEGVAKKGHYKNRIYIAEHVSSLHINGQHKLITILLDDPVEYISQKTIESSKSLRLLDELKKRIVEKKKFWAELKKQREDNAKANAEIYKNLTNYKRKFSDGDSYKQLKQAIKKPMNTGKWI